LMTSEAGFRDNLEDLFLDWLLVSGLFDWCFCLGCCFCLIVTASSDLAFGNKRPKRSADSLFEIEKDSEEVVKELLNEGCGSAIELLRTLFDSTLLSLLKAFEIGMVLVLAVLAVVLVVLEIVLVSAVLSLRDARSG